MVKQKLTKQNDTLYIQQKCKLYTTKSISHIQHENTTQDGEEKSGYGEVKSIKRQMEKEPKWRRKKVANNRKVILNQSSST